jgi:hypothetical protein
MKVQKDAAKQTPQVLMRVCIMNENINPDWDYKENLPVCKGAIDECVCMPLAKASSQGEKVRDIIG